MIYFLNDHKTGSQITNKLVEIFNTQLTQKIQVETFYHFSDDYNGSDKYIIITRHPKDIIISGYLYHKICKEEWATNIGGDYYKSVKNLKPKAMLDSKNNLLTEVKPYSTPKTYQNKLLNLPQNEGIKYEMNCVAKLTIDGLYRLPHHGKDNVLFIKLEDLIFNYDNTINVMCEYIGLGVTNKILNDCKKHDLIRNNGVNTFKGNIITNTELKKNRFLEYWDEELEEEFVKLFPNDVLEKLGYV